MDSTFSLVFVVVLFIVLWWLSRHFALAERLYVWREIQLWPSQRSKITFAGLVCGLYLSWVDTRESYYSNKGNKLGFIFFKIYDEYVWEVLGYSTLSKMIHSD